MTRGFLRSAAGCRLGPHTVALVVVLTLVAPSLAPAAAAAQPVEPVELRLLRTIFVGAPQQIELEQIRRLASPDTGSTRYHLARAALRVLRQEAGKPGLGLLLARLLEQLHLQREDLLPESLPAGFGDDDLIYTLVRALAVTGGLGAAEKILLRELEIGGQYKKYVILEALHQLGSRGAKAGIQKASELGDLWQLASNLLTDYRSPTLQELARYWSTIDHAGRERSQLLAVARQGCDNSGPGLMAVHLLGYLAPHPVKNVEASELGLLRSLVIGAPCSNGRLFAAQALALRSPELPLVWRRAVDSAASSWERRQLLRAFWVRQPQALAKEALERLGHEPTQLVQWELMWGLIKHEEGVPFRDLWGLWFLSPNFQFRLENARRYEVINAEAVDRLLDWLEQGHRPADDRALEWLMVSVIRGATGEQVPRALAQLEQSGLPAEMRWSYSETNDPAALPWLRRRLDESEEGQPRDRLERTIENLERREAIAKRRRGKR